MEKSERSREEVAEQETGDITGGGGFKGNSSKEKDKKCCGKILEFPTEK